MGKLAQEAHRAHRQALADSRTAATSASTSPLPDAAQLLQQSAAELLRQQLQLLTVDSQEAESALLSQLLRACTVTSGLITAFSAAPAGTSTAWLPQDVVAGTL